MTTNDIQQIIDLVEHCPCCRGHSEVKVLKDLVKQVENQPMTAIQIAIIKSPKITDTEF